MEEYEDFEPCEDDIFTYDHETFYQNGKPAIDISIDCTKEEMWEAIEEHMARDKFWPNVWFVSDHGNIHLMERGN